MKMFFLKIMSTQKAAWVITAATLVLTVVALALYIRPLVTVGLVLMALSTLLHRRFWLCRHCGIRLKNRFVLPESCPACGEALKEEGRTIDS